MTRPVESIEHGGRNEANDTGSQESKGHGVDVLNLGVDIAEVIEGLILQVWLERPVESVQQ